jgi:hypothetical protein
MSIPRVHCEAVYLAIESLVQSGALNANCTYARTAPNRCQFALYGDCRKGRRFSFIEAAPGVGRPAVSRLRGLLKERVKRVETGVSQAHMEVSLVNTMGR